MENHTTNRPNHGANNNGVSLLAAPKQDLLSSFVVFLVALPLCMGIAIASGVDPARGLVTGIVGGIIVGLLTGSPLAVSGPAAGLTVIVFDFLNKKREAFLAQQGDLETLSESARAAVNTEALNHALVAFGLAVVLAGVIQLAAGLFKLGTWFRAVSPAVIKGMLAGIGVLIFSSQFHVMVDDDPAASGVTNLLTIPRALYKGLVPLDGSTHHLAAATGALTIITIICWEKFAPSKLSLVPGPLVGIIVATSFAWIMRLDIMNLDVPHNLSDNLTYPSTDWMTLLFDKSVLIAAVVLAVVASAETLLCANAVDQLHNGPRTKYDKELVGQGVGNIVCGCLGALPMTAVIVRSKANLDAGAKSPLSAILHGVWLLAFVVTLPFVLNYIPRASLGAILVYIGYKLINPKSVLELWKYGKSEVLIYLVTITVIVVEDLLTGIIVGSLLSAAKLLYNFSHLKTAIDYGDDDSSAVLKLQGSATFIRLPALADVLERIPPDTELHVDFEGLSYIDHACLELLVNWAKQHESAGGTLVIDWESLYANFRRDEPEPINA